MKAVIDQRKCSGAGECVKLMPELFRFEPGSKKARASEEDVTNDQLTKLAKALDACPAGAIELVP